MNEKNYTLQVKEALSKICSGGPPDAVLLVGQEAHACIEITAMDLRDEGFEVHAVADCISSRSQEDRLYALDVKSPSPTEYINY